MTKVALVIPARLGSTRLSEKPLRDLAGKPLIVRVWERVKTFGISDRVVVATDHPSIQKLILDLGGEVVMTSETCSSGTERVAEVATKDSFSSIDTFVNVQGDEPFIGESSVREATDLVISGDFEIGTSAISVSSEVQTDPSIVKVVRATNGAALYFSRSPIPFMRDPADADLLKTSVLQHIGVYAYSRNALLRWRALPPHPLETIEKLEQLRPLANGLRIGVAVVNEVAEAGIDTETDLARAVARYASRQSQ